ncbi:MAG: hypothetical protein NTX59_07835 [Elusimicrobia bacterium]|nr:hypothetical protein [Elusimicrobiota bacterium]
MEKGVKILVDTKKHSVESVRYAGYSLSGEAYVLLKPSGRAETTVELAPKNGARADSGGLKKRFLSGLEEENNREAVFKFNLELREFMLLKALSYEEKAPEPKDSGLSPDQEKELDALIAQVENELKEESKKASSRDPLGITRIWEEKNDSKRSKSKSK